MKIENGEIVIDITPTARDWPLEQSPITLRLRNALQRCDYHVLGELHGKKLKNLKKVRGCGVGSITDFEKVLTRLHSGEFDVLAAVRPEDALDRIVSIIDESCIELSARNRDIVLSRLGAHRNPLALAEIGFKYGLTRERVRQLVESKLEHIRCHNGPPFLQLLQVMMKRCEEAVCPLTPDLFACWIDPEQVRRYQPSFYVRVIAGLVREGPVWAEDRGQGAPVERHIEITTEVKRLLNGRMNPLEAREALRLLNEQHAFSTVTAAEFLDAIRGDCSVGIRFGRPDQLLVLPPAPETVECLKQALQHAAHPLNVREIAEWAGGIWGDRALSHSSRYLKRYLQRDKGICRLDEGTYGLRRHIHLPESDWTRVRDDVHELLGGEEWNVSSFDIIKQNCFDWTSAINAYELAEILRGDPRLSETEDGSFMLTTPGMRSASPTSLAVPMNA